MRGKLIVFEGVDGAGKTTQLQQIAQWLQQNKLLPPEHPIEITHEPGATRLGSHLRQLLLETEGWTDEFLRDRTELLLYAADRTQHVDSFLNPKLEQGTIILCDRYIDSTTAYQGYGRGLNLTLIDQLNAIATSGLESDLTLWLDVDVTVGLARMRRRGETDRMEQADLAFYQRVQRGFATLYQSNPQRIVRIDGNQSEAAVTEQIQTVLNQRLIEWYSPPSHPYLDKVRPPRS